MPSTITCSRFDPCTSCSVQQIRVVLSATQVGYHDEFCRSEHEVKYWSECSVSEDFDLYIRLASNNMFGRYVM